MRFAILFPLIALGLCLIVHNNGGWTWILLWPALSFFIVGIAYALATPRVFGKRPDGTMAWWAVLTLFPFLIYTWALWHAVRLAHRVHSSEPYASRISSRVWVARRITRRELPPGVTCVVDMTCEFPAAAGLVGCVARYDALPTLDYGTPPVEQACSLIETLQACEGDILVHCAQGHGRSALFAAALLVATNVAGDAEDALRIVKKGRPNARLTPRQRDALKALVQRILFQRSGQSAE